MEKLEKILFSRSCKTNIKAKINSENLTFFIENLKFDQYMARLIVVPLLLASGLYKEQITYAMEPSEDIKVKKILSKQLLTTQDIYNLYCEYLTLANKPQSKDDKKRFNQSKNSYKQYLLNTPKYYLKRL